jgi:hypothetical protein
MISACGGAIARAKMARRLGQNALCARLAGYPDRAGGSRSNLTGDVKSEGATPVARAMRAAPVAFARAGGAALRFTSANRRLLSPKVAQTGLNEAQFTLTAAKKAREKRA